MQFILVVPSVKTDKGKNTGSEKTGTDYSLISFFTELTLDTELTLGKKILRKMVARVPEDPLSGRSESPFLFSSLNS